MILNRLSELTDFIAGNSAAKAPLEAWKTLIERNAFKHFVQLKRTFGAADYSSPYTIFDVGGNKFRVVAVVNYEAQVVFIRRVMTHGQYDEWCRARSKGKGKKK